MEQASTMEQTLMRSLQLQNEKRFRFGVAIATIGGIVAYTFYPHVKDKTSSEIAEVAGGALEDAEVIRKAETLATAVVNRVLNDPAVMQMASSFVGDLSRDAKVQRSVVDLTNYTLAHQATLDQALKLSQWVVQKILEDPQTVQQIVAGLKRVAADPEMQQSLVELIRILLAQEPVRKELVNLTNGVMVDPAFLRQSAELGSWISKQVLDDEAVYLHTCDFCQAVLNDTALQQTASGALWESVKGIVSPSMWFGGATTEIVPPESGAAESTSGADTSAGEEPDGGSDTVEAPLSLPTAKAPSD
eukprot:g3478.t1